MMMRLLDDLVDLYARKLYRCREMVKLSQQMTALDFQDERFSQKLHVLLEDRAQHMADYERLDANTELVWTDLAQEFCCEYQPQALLKGYPCQQTASIANMHDEVQALLLQMHKLGQAYASAIAAEKEKLQSELGRMQSNQRAQKLYKALPLQNSGVFLDCKTG